MRIKQILVNINFVLKNILPILFLSKEKEIAKYLTNNAIRLCVAESCTGGLISSRITDVSGSSAYIFQNIVTYANSAKIRLLGVNPETIEKHGVVSNEVALEMVDGALKNYDCTLVVSATGIAGPTGATATKPLGLVYFGIGNEKVKKSYKFEANPLLYRRIMKYAFSSKILELILEFLKENY